MELVSIGPRHQDIFLSLILVGKFTRPDSVPVPLKNRVVAHTRNIHEDRTTFIRARIHCDNHMTTPTATTNKTATAPSLSSLYSSLVSVDELVELLLLPFLKLCSSLSWSAYPLVVGSPVLKYRLAY